MYAIVEIAGHQYKVRQDQQIYVNRLSGEEGSDISFDRVLLTGKDNDIEVGAPVISGIQVDAKIVSHLKADKVIVFKKKRRKGYKVKNGHRQAISLIEIVGIGKPSSNGSSSKKEKAPASSPKKSEAPKAETAKAETPKAKTKTAEKKEEAKDLNSMTVAELKELAKEKGLTGYSSLKKDELIKALS